MFAPVIRFVPVIRHASTKWRPEYAVDRTLRRHTVLSNNGSGRRRPQVAGVLRMFNLRMFNLRTFNLACVQPLRTGRGSRYAVPLDTELKKHVR